MQTKHSARPVLTVPRILIVLGVFACAKPISDALLSASAPERNVLLHDALQEAGYDCPGVFDMPVQDRSWRVSCNNGLTYLALLEDDGAVGLEPLYYGDVVRPGPPVDRLPLMAPRER
jgi:hypothetical protein